MLFGTYAGMLKSNTLSEKHWGKDRRTMGTVFGDLVQLCSPNIHTKS